jgi:hypothetical protein
VTIIKTSSVYRGSLDHFEPDNLDAAEQRRVRGHLEQIDYTAFAANQAVLEQTPGPLDLETIKRVAVAAALARGQWLKAALQIAEPGQTPTPEDFAALAARRQAFEELREAYEGLRRMIERGYVPFKSS